MHGRVAALCSRGGHLADEPFVQCVRRNEVDVVRAVLERCQTFNADLTDEHGNTPLRYALENRSFEMCKLLLLAGAEVNVRWPDGTTPLSLARARNLEEIAILLLHYGAVESGEAEAAPADGEGASGLDSLDGEAAQRA
ncbi:MAG: ankyrin repeat domain-containing protein [Desulfovibrionaceae bacterium]